MKPKAEKTFPTQAELEALWRGDPNFIGPIGPPMVIWINDEEAQARWRIAMNLEGTYPQPNQTELSLEPPDELIDFARLTAQGRGKALLPEQIEVLDAEIAARCTYARVWVGEYGSAGFGWEAWGRQTYVLESVLSFLQRLDADPEAKDYIAKRFRKG